MEIRRRLMKNLFWGVLVGFAAVTYITVSPLAKEYVETKMYAGRFEKAAYRALSHYGNKNKDGSISKKEKHNLMLDVYKNQGIILMDEQPPRYIDGGKVQLKTLTELMESYVPSK